MLPSLQGRLIVVTGGTGELGQHVCLDLHARGARIAMTFLSEQQMQAFAARHPEAAQGIRFLRVDARDGDKVRRAMDELSASEGAPHGLVNLIGGYSHGPPVLDSELDDFQRMMDLNFAPTYHFCRSVVPRMVEAGRGHVVNVGARAGLSASANHAAYSIAKSAVIRLTEALGEEVKHHNVNVNCVLPSVIDTTVNRRDLPAEDFSHWVAPADLAQVIAFLLSDASRPIHGAAIPVYGRI
jgi:NAD(P)-dependent dehydrogenase (short-subunit alcohol dehydrogenase family)